MVVEAASCPQRAHRGPFPQPGNLEVVYQRLEEKAEAAVSTHW